MISKELLEILACPRCKGGVELTERGLECGVCGVVYEVVDDVPMMILDTGGEYA